MSRSEQAVIRRQFGEKLDEFGSTTDEKQSEPNRLLVNRAIRGSLGGKVCDVPVDLATARARCLAELATALDQAEAVLRGLPLVPEVTAEVVALAQRIEAARMETLSLRLMRQARGPVDPDWTKFAPWQDGDRSSA